MFWGLFYCPDFPFACMIDAKNERIFFMAWIPPVQLNMDYSRAFLEWNPKNRVVAAIRKIALTLIIPFVLIVFSEAVFKNLVLFGAINTGITLINLAHSLFFAAQDGAAARQ